MRRIAAVLLFSGCGMLLTPGLSAQSGSPLIDAVKRRVTAAAQALLSRRQVPVDATDPDGSTALHWAIQRDDAAMVGRLLAGGAKPATPTRFNLKERIADGDWLRVWNRRGEVMLKAVVSDHVKPGVAWSPSLWWHRDSPCNRNVNALTSDRLTDMGGGSTFHTNLIQFARARD